MFCRRLMLLFVVVAHGVAPAASASCQHRILAFKAGLPDSLVLTGPCSVVISRVAADDAERQALVKAEAIAPDADVLHRFDQAMPDEGDGTCVTAAASGYAVNYYIALSKALPLLHADVVTSLSYTARVIPGSEDHRDSDLGGGRRRTYGARVAVLTLEWTQLVDGFVGPYIAATRWVVFDKDNNVLAVEGDGETSVVVP